MWQFCREYPNMHGKLHGLTEKSVKIPGDSCILSMPNNSIDHYRKTIYNDSQ